MNTRTHKVLEQLAAHESRNVTYVDPDGSWPIVWERARGAYVYDLEGRRYLDLTAAFGVANAGHANPRVVRAGQRQMGLLLHAMGDVHPHALKAELARHLSRLTFERWEHRPGKVIFGNSGFEAVEAALKTAMLASGRECILAFKGAYHGLGYGTLNATHRDLFREPFRRQLSEFATFIPYPTNAPEMAETERALRRAFRQEKPGAVLVEPVQGRGGIQVPPRNFLRRLRELCDNHGALLILDEIYTGFGRTGRWFACEHSRVTPDLICLGKGLTGGFPLSACVGRSSVMDRAWPLSGGEAIHTSTFLGHPVGCAMALAQLGEIQRLRLPERASRSGKTFLNGLRGLERSNPRLRLSARGVGLMLGLEIQLADGTPASHEALAVVKAMLHSGYVLLPEGPAGNVVSFTPPLTVTPSQINSTINTLGRVLARL